MTTDTFDSRALRRTDCYGQRFMRPGTYRYALVPATWSPAADDFPYTIQVTDAPDRDAVMEQHTVRVRQDGARFVPEQHALEIATGDLVVWNCRDSRTTPFAVAGEKDFFGNAALVNESGFSHAFGSAGEYEWADAHGSDLRGVVRVSDPRVTNSDDYQRWRRQLATGSVVMINGRNAEPAEVEIVTGQTVYFAVTKSDGISVTDARLLQVGPEQPRPKLPTPAKPPRKRPTKKTARKRT
jgi:plastocyanin